MTLALYKPLPKRPLCAWLSDWLYTGPAIASCVQVTFLHALLEIAQERVMRDVAIPTTLAIQHWQHHALRRRVHVGKREIWSV